MVRNINKDVFFLKQKSSLASLLDKVIGQDLKETLLSHSHECVGMAANMIGVSKRIICFKDEQKLTIMYNPVILDKKEPYETQEGCLSLKGERSTIRYKKIKVSYLDEDFKQKIKTYYDFTAQIIQHEIDHCDGILI